MSIRKLPKVKVNTHHIPFEGGLDTETPLLKVKSGTVRSSQNVYQGIDRCYWTFGGYERYSGQDKPSDATYTILLNVTITGSISLGDTVTSDAGTGTGVVIALPTDQIVLTKVSGTFETDGDSLLVSASPVATYTTDASGNYTSGMASTRRLNAQYKALAADVYRDDISAASGSGQVRGIWYYDGDWYVFRNNSGGTAEGMFKASSSGWTAVSLGRELSFTSGGTTEIEEGDTITGNTSGATAVVTRVVRESGTWDGGDAAGRIIFASQTGTFQAETLDIGGTSDVATISGDSTAITFAVPDGRFEFDNTNFRGSTATYRMYGCDGKNRGFEFDGSVFVPISTGMSPDAPEHIIEHQYHLFMSFGSQMQHSMPGDPYRYSILTEAELIGMGDDITSMIPQLGSESGAAMTVFTDSTFGTLYGTGSDDWQLVHKRKTKTGAVAYSAQVIGNTFSLDAQGISKLWATDKYGNFGDASVSKHIKTWMLEKHNQLNASVVISSKSQYWLFFSDKSALCCTIDGGEIVAAMPMLFEHEVTCACSAVVESGEEVVMLGCGDGHVRQMFSGTSLDGESLEWFMDLSYDHLGHPEINKKFRGLRLYAEGEGYAEYYFTYEMSYGDQDIAPASIKGDEIQFDPGNWDSGSYYDAGERWDGKSIDPRKFRIYGSGENISLKLRGNSTFHAPLKFSGALLQFNFTREKH